MNNLLLTLFILCSSVAASSGSKSTNLEKIVDNSNPNVAGVRTN